MGSQPPPTLDTFEPSISWFSVAACFTAIAAIVLSAAVRMLTQFRARGLPPLALSTSLKMLISPALVIDLKLQAKKTLGDVYTLLMGGEPIVILAGYDVIHEAFVSNAEICSSRPPGLGRLLLGGKNNAGVVCTESWKEQRRVVTMLLRELGMGRIELEPRILDETRAINDEIARQCGRPFDVDSHIHRATSNVICNMVLGTRFDYADSSFQAILDGILEQMSKVRRVVVAEKLPILQRLPGDVFGYHRFMRDSEAHCAYFRDVIRRHAETLDEDNPRDFIDAYLIESRKSAQENPEQSSLNEENLVHTVLQLFVAGTDTTATALLWAWFFMITNPDVQRRVHEEIDAHIGSRQPSLRDRIHMPFTEAVLSEVLRIGNVATATVPHFTNGDVIVAWKRIPKGTVIQASISDVHLDEAVYSQPLKFDPTRHLNSSGEFEKLKRLLPFGVGRRSCLGENLARAEMFLFFTSVLQRYNLRCPEGVAVQTSSRFRLSRKPPSYAIVFTPRRETGSY